MSDVMEAPPNRERIGPVIGTDNVEHDFAEAADSAQPADTDAEKVYSHTLQDGREVSGTREQAQKVCPVLGAMSVEKAQSVLNKADLLQRVAERGKAKREAREEKAQNDKESKEDAKTVSSKPVKDKISSDQQAGVTSLAKKPTAVDKTSDNDLHTNPDRSSKKTSITLLPPHDSTKHIPSRASTTETALDDLSVKCLTDKECQKDPEISPEKPVVNKQVAVVELPEPLSSHVKKKDEDNGGSTYVEITNDTITNEQTASTTTHSETNDDELLDVLKDYLTSETSADEVPDERPMLRVEDNELKFDTDLPAVEMFVPPIAELTDVEEDEETIATYDQIVMLINKEPEKESAAAFNSQGLAPENEMVIFDQDVDAAVGATELAITNAFEAMVSSETAPEEPVLVELIIAAAAEEPLENTLVQLSYVLSEVPDEPSEEYQSIKQLLKDTDAVFHKPNTVNAKQKAVSEEVRITPEATQKLLLLLRTVGYQNPQAVLVEFIEKYNFKLLAQALSYLYQLSEDYNRQEFSSLKSTTSSPIADESINIRGIGSTIFKLLIADLESPEAIATWSSVSTTAA